MSWWGVLASLTLIAVAVGLSLWMRLGLERTLLWAATRAAAQLLAVGLLFRLIFESDRASLYAAAWIVGMVGIATVVVQRRAPAIPGLWRFALLAIAASTGVVLGVVFGLGVLDAEPVSVLVIAGITIGNTVPSTVLAVDQVAGYFRDNRDRIDGLLALGFDASATARFVSPLTARTALIPQIERTKVVGLIALPGAMTGLLLAGVAAFDAVMLQLVIMYLVLGSVAVAVVVVTATAVTSSFARGLRLPEWSGRP